ncbi:MAG: hypothetical protein WD070_09060 [Pirellulaceae bacterium]
MNQLGKNLVFSLCLVATLLVVLGVKRKFSGDGEAVVLSQPARESQQTASNSSRSSPQPRVLQAKPIMQNDRIIVSPTGPRNAGAEAASLPAGAFPFSPIPTASRNPIASPRSLDAPELVPVDEPNATPALGSVGDEEPEDASQTEGPTFPVATRPLPEFVLTSAEDSFWSISEQIYGTGAYYRALFRHNETKVLRPDQLRAGIEVRTPPLEVLKELYPDDYPADPPGS